MQTVQYLQVIVFLKTFPDFVCLIYESTKSQILGTRRAIVLFPLTTQLTGLSIQVNV